MEREARSLPSGGKGGGATGVLFFGVCGLHIGWCIRNGGR